MKGIKNEIRKEMLNQRNLLTHDEILKKSLIISEKLLSLDSFVKSTSIMTYVNFGSEVDTSYFIEACLKKGKRVAVPLVVRGEDGKRGMLAVEIKDLEKDLERGSYGILEPKFVETREIPPAAIDLVVVPGVVFDMDKYRIGYGGGYYDRFLLKVGMDCIKIGVAFDMQFCHGIPVEKHDIPVDFVVTESRTIY